MKIISQTNSELSQVLELADKALKQYYNYIPYILKIRDMEDI